MTDKTYPSLASNAGNGAPCPTEHDYGAKPPPADQDPGLPTDFNMGQPVVPDDVDSIYGHTQGR